MGLGPILVSLVACKSEPKAESSAAGSAATAATAPPAAAGNDSPKKAEATAGASGTAPTGTIAGAANPSNHDAAPADAPASFKDGTKESIPAAVGLGCEAKSLNGWLEFLCRKKNGTGGHPTKAEIQVLATNLASPEAAVAGSSEPVAVAGGAEQADAGTPANPNEVLPDEHGELRLVVPYRPGEKRDVVLAWSDTRYTLHLDGTKATIEWAASGVPHRRACQKLLDENKAVIDAAQKLDGEERVTAAESKLPRFGVCQAGGLGSWALLLRSLKGAGTGAQRSLHLEADVVRVDIDGSRMAAPFGAFEIRPGGLEIGFLQAYDYDDDGNDELIVPFELKAASSTPASELPSAVWSFSASGVAPYAKAKLAGGAGAEQLDFDMRPDIGTYAGFVAYFAADCGLKSCPSRVTGPKFFLHSLPDGGFSGNDDAARAALKRACPKLSGPVVAEAGGQANLAQTARNLVCARAHGAEKAALASELDARRAALCGDAPSCAAQTALLGWLELPLPVELRADKAAR
jgi:hypothetical protein